MPDYDPLMDRGIAPEEDTVKHTPRAPTAEVEGEVIRSHVAMVSG